MRKYIVLAAITILLLLVANPVLAAPSKDNHKPVSATDIEIVKKVTLKGPAAKGGKPSGFAATGILGDQLPFGGKRYAIVIGINDYPGSSSDLQYAVNDANEMASILTDLYHFDIVDTLTNSAATYEKIQGKIETLETTAGTSDEVVFFFSGHGAKGKANDSDRNNTDQSIVVNKADGSWGYIWDGELKSWFSNFTVNRIVFIFDSCLSGGMAVLNAPGRVVNMACSINGLSYEGDAWGGGHGQFTYYFAEEGMHDKNADVRPKDTYVTVEEAFDYAKVNCQFQTPTITDGFTSDMLP
jgi:hypothetical protein